MKCPICKIEMMPNFGPQNSDVLIIKDFDQDEYEMLSPYSSFGSKILRNEFGIYGIDFRQCRVVYLERHSCKGKDAKKCSDAHVQMAVEQAKNRKVILLLGAKSCLSLTEKQVSKVSGLRITSKLLSCDAIIATFNPAIVLHSGVGEFRLAIERFSDALDEVLSE
jgi:hypothetical protein